MALIGPFIAINDQAKWPNLTNSAFLKAKTSVTPQTNTGHLLNPKKRKKKKQRKTSLGPQSMEEENKLIVCRTVGRPLIFPNVIEGVYTHFENRGRREKKGGLERGGWKNKKKGKEKRKRKKRKKFDNAVRVERVSGRHPCSGGVLLAGFRGVEIPHNVRDVCVDSF